MKTQSDVLHARYRAACNRLAALPHTDGLLAILERARLSEGLAVAVVDAENMAEVLTAADAGMRSGGLAGVLQALLSLHERRQAGKGVH